MGFATLPIAEMAVRWDLARHIVVDVKLPEEALESVFLGAINRLEVITNTQIENSTRMRIWYAVSGERLRILKQTFLYECCEKVLRDFRCEEVIEILSQYRETGAIRDIVYSSRVQTTVTLNLPLIIDAVVKKTFSMIDAWMPEIVEAAINEGVELTKTSAGVH